ncbi:hypothetical protein F5Y11DRAFT_229751 [Daldinia sp. FL1419]|nr:hypothetical protein F5Y11DRAFT_229751 [Daldinia sp. FL1419]
MDPSPPQDLHARWVKEKERMLSKHREELDFHEGLFEKEMQELRESNERDLQRLKRLVPAEVYRDIVLHMAQKSLRIDAQEIEASYQKRTGIIEKEQKAALARHEIAYQEELKIALCMNGDLNTSTISAQNRPVSLPEDSNKRKAPVAKEHPPKRPRVDTYVDTLKTPADAPMDDIPLDGNAQRTGQTITFDEVYQNGEARHKDTIVEWPSGSQKWYILKCEEHQVRFTKNAVRGAAVHLAGMSHGFPKRHWDVAVKTFGYLVVDCTAELAEINNRAAEKAYENEYKQPLPVSNKQPKKTDKLQKNSHQKGAKSRSSFPAKKGVGRSPKNPRVQNRQKLDTSMSRRNTPNSQNIIKNPKTFHIYYGRWKSSSGLADKSEIYPVMILGWDSQDGSGLKKGTTLNDTSLLDKGSSPPSCYIYGSNKIVGWAPGYEDGGAKVDSRRFPVMFFDEFQTVAWLQARYLTKFPMYKRTPPPEPDHPFNAACRWIAEREGFNTWEEKLQARYPLISQPPSISPITSAGDESFKTTARPGGLKRPEGLSDATDHNSADDKDDSDSRSYSSEAMSAATVDTEMLEWREKGGEIPGDEDYKAAESGTSSTSDSEIDDWEKPSSHATKPGALVPPWAWYSLRSIERSEEFKKPTSTSRESGDNRLSTSVALGMKSARGPQESDPAQYTDRLDELTSKNRAARAPQTGVGCVTPLSLGVIGTGEAHIENRSIGGGKNAEPSTCEASKGVKPTSNGKAQINSSGDLAALGSKQTVASDSEHDDLVARHETAVDKEGLVKNMQTTTGESVQTTPRKEDENTAGDHSKVQLPEAGIVTSINSLAAPSITEEVPPSNRSVGNPFSDSTSAPGRADFELSHCSNGVTSWKRSSDEEDCIKLFHDKDRKIMATWGGPMDVIIDLTEVITFSREIIPGSQGNSTVTLNNKDGTSWKLVFGQSKESDLLVGKIQSRRFIRWLRNANPGITCLGEVGPLEKIRPV